MPDLKAIEARLAKATANPWSRDAIDLIAHARQDLADLLAYVRELKEALGAFVGDENCDITRDSGWCWSHGHYVDRNGECPVARARRLTSE